MENNLELYKQITFNELVKHGIENGANTYNNIPWSWKINGKCITHERDDLYLIECVSGIERFEEGDQIRTTEQGLVYLPYSNNATHSPGGCPM